MMRELAEAATRPETPDLDGAYPRLSQAQLDTLEPYGERRPVRAGEALFVEGDPSELFHIVLAGRVALIEGYGTDDQRVVRVHGPRWFLGELSLLAGQTEFFTAVVVEDGEVLALPVDGLRAAVSGNPALGDEILRALPGPPHAGDRPGGWLPHRRLALFAGHSAAARFRHAQPAAAPFHRRGKRSRRGESVAAVRHRA
jgi:hypothetical protein